jgi:small subunit ribosomal protein S9
MSTNFQYIFQKDNIGIGRRKQAVVRVFLTPGDGKIIINKIAGERYLHYNTTYLDNIWAPLKKLDLNEKYDVIVIAKGGGLTGQANAIQLGIARLLCQENMLKLNWLLYRSILKPCGYLTRDPRVKERKKYGLKKARKAPQYSKR